MDLCISLKTGITMLKELINALVEVVLESYAVFNSTSVPASIILVLKLYKCYEIFKI
jgi:hypothetical protein